MASVNLARVVKRDTDILSLGSRDSLHCRRDVVYASRQALDDG